MNKRQHRVSLSEQGFTLMEVMVVTAIVGVMAAIAIPNYLSWKPGYEFRGAVSRVTGDINKARMRALEIRRECRVLFCGNAYQIIDGDQTMYSNWPAPPAGACLTSAQQTALENAGRRVRNISLADYNQVTVTAAAAAMPTFSPRGLATTTGTITVNHPKTNGADVVTSVTGRVRVAWK